MSWRIKFMQGEVLVCSNVHPLMVLIEAAEKNCVN